LEFAENNIKSFLNDEKGAALGKTFDHVKFFRRNCFLPSIDDTLYDKIHVGACCPDAKIQDLYNLLAPGGTLVTPYGDRLIKAVKDREKLTMNVTTLVEVRYSDLLLPSAAEVKEAQKQIEIARASKMTVPPDKRVKRLGHMVNNKICSDLLFDVNGRPIYGHKLVIELQAPAFFEKVKNEKVVKIDHCGAEAFLSMLQFLYTGRFTTAPEYWNEMLEIAKNFHLDTLENIVRAKMSNQPLPNIVSFAEALSQYIGQEKYSDVKFALEDTLIPAHKLMLVSQCDHFKKMFAGNFKESQDGVIKIFDCSVETFMKVLDFIYTGQCNITEQNCFGILEQANFFQLTRLIAMCENFWYNQINIDNAASLLEFAHHVNATQLKQFAMEYIFKHVKEVVSTPAWRELDIDLISSVLVFSVERAK
jgi:hypothetical protein